MNRRQVAVLGSTGSIGVSTLDVLAHLQATRPEDGWRVSLLSGHSRLDLLAEQAERFRPAQVVITGPPPDQAQLARLKQTGAVVHVGTEALAPLTARPDTGGTVVAAIVGAAGLPAVMAAVEAGKRICLANKESLVVAGHLLMPLARRTGSELLPVDSEHSAIYQAMLAGRRAEVARVILTASGGPFRTLPAHALTRVTREQALNHPTWKMGGKISIDSATLFNKALELIEARWLFELPPEQLAVMVHPQSIVHSLVEFRDGNVLAQLSPPDMRTPIQYALTYPERAASRSLRMDWSTPLNLTFEPPDTTRFASLDLAMRVLRQDGPEGGTAAAVLNAANEVAVAAFLAGRARFTDITAVVDTVLNRHRHTAAPDLAALLSADQWAREEASRVLADIAQLLP